MGTSGRLASLLRGILPEKSANEEEHAVGFASTAAAFDGNSSRHTRR